MPRGAVGPDGYEEAQSSWPVAMFIGLITSFVTLGLEPRLVGAAIGSPILLVRTLWPLAAISQPSLDPSGFTRLEVFGALAGFVMFVTLLATLYRFSLQALRRSISSRHRAWGACCVAAALTQSSCSSVLPPDPAFMPRPSEAHQVSAGPVAKPVPRTPADSVAVGGWLGRYLIHIARGGLER